MSRLTLDELAEAPRQVRDFVEALSSSDIVEIAIDNDVEDLAQAYVSMGALGQASMGDALHVAAATVAGADIILSWNFKHIVNYARIQKFNGVNALNGYPHIAIHSPLEVTYDYENEKL